MEPRREHKQVVNRICDWTDANFGRMIVELESDRLIRT